MAAAAIPLTGYKLPKKPENYIKVLNLWQK